MSKFERLDQLRWNHNGECEYHSHFYFTKAEKLDSLERILFHDRSAAEKIKDAENMIAVLKEYRQSLFERSQIITAANYHLRLTLTREVHYYDKKKYYQIEIAKIFDRKDIAPESILSERYEGTERHKAIKRYEELRKSHPGIESEMDIAKKHWEK